MQGTIRLAFLFMLQAFFSTGELVSFEDKSQNDTENTEIARLMQNKYAPSRAKLYLNYARHAMDRGYWSFSVISKLNEVGFQVCGTVKRFPWFAYAHDQV